MLNENCGFLTGFRTGGGGGTRPSLSAASIQSLYILIPSLPVTTFKAWPRYAPALAFKVGFGPYADSGITAKTLAILLSRCKLPESLKRQLIDYNGAPGEIRTPDRLVRSHLFAV